MTAKTIVPAKLAGRCCSGEERGQGSRIHALSDAYDNSSTLYGHALCGAKPGHRSVGWTPMRESSVSCPRCLKRLAKMGEQS